jgi:hypothetical protein
MPATQQKPSQTYLKSGLVLKYRIEKDDSHKGAKHTKFGEIRGFFFATWRFGAINFVELVLFKI